MKLAAEAARDVFDVRVEAAILVDHDDPRQLAAHLRRFGEEPLDRAVALRRLHRHHLGLDPRVVFRDLLGQGVVRLHFRENRRGGQAADGELAGPLQKRPPVDVAVLVLVKEVQQLLRVVRGFLSFHENAP